MAEIFRSTSECLGHALEGFRQMAETFLSMAVVFRSASEHLRHLTRSFGEGYRLAQVSGPSSEDAELLRPRGFRTS